MVTVEYDETLNAVTETEKMLCQALARESSGGGWDVTAKTHRISWFYAQRVKAVAAQRCLTDVCYEKLRGTWIVSITHHQFA